MVDKNHQCDSVVRNYYRRCESSIVNFYADADGLTASECSELKQICDPNKIQYVCSDKVRSELNEGTARMNRFVENLYIRRLSWFHDHPEIQGSGFSRFEIQVEQNIDPFDLYKEIKYSGDRNDLATAILHARRNHGLFLYLVADEKLSDPAIDQELQRLALNGDSKELRAKAMNTAELFSTKENYKALLESGMESEHDDVRGRSALSLFSLAENKRLPPGSAIDRQLRRTVELEDGDRWMRIGAMKALAISSAKGFAGYLKDRLKDKREDIRILALEALDQEKIGSNVHLTLLKAVARSDKNDLVRGIAAKLAMDEYGEWEALYVADGKFIPVIPGADGKYFFFDGSEEMWNRHINVPLWIISHWIEEEKYAIRRSLAFGLSSLPSKLKSSIKKIIFLSGHCDDPEAGACAPEGKIYVQDATTFSISKLAHEAAHLLTGRFTDGYSGDSPLEKEWYEVAVRHANYSYGHDLKPDGFSKRSIEWASGAPYGPRHGCVQPYGCKNMQEDIATIVGEIFSDYDTARSLVMNDKIISEKVDILFKYGFITEKQYRRVKPKQP